jgi:UDP-N-acetylmuramyl pentapeptide phosphotransferase/UDP-N-acetylglucosamine-1-phosphate transferase
MSGRASWQRAAGRLVLAGAGVALVRAALGAAHGWSPPGTDAASYERPDHPVWARTNFRGHPVSLAAGPALAVAASLGAAGGAVVEGSPALAASALVAGLGAGAVGCYDDVVGARPDQRAKGFRGHLAALREGRVTSGLVKIVGVGAAGLAAAALLPNRPGRGRVRRGADTLLGAGVIAGTANLVNLLDLRPGRAVKAGLLIGAPLAGSTVGGAVAGPLGAAAGVLPDDLAERVMLGDCGANALGAVLGVALAARTDTVGRAVILAGLAALTGASERVSFTRVIEATPGLRELDALGRRP